MLMTERRPTFGTIEGWAGSVLLEAGAIHECEGQKKGPRRSAGPPLRPPRRPPKIRRPASLRTRRSPLLAMCWALSVTPARSVRLNRRRRRREGRRHCYRFGAQDGFFHPLAGVADLHRPRRPAGLLQFITQFVVLTACPTRALSERTRLLTQLLAPGTIRKSTTPRSSPIAASCRQHAMDWACVTPNQPPSIA